MVPSRGPAGGLGFCKQGLVVKRPISHLFVRRPQGLFTQMQFGRQNLSNSGSGNINTIGSLVAKMLGAINFCDFSVFFSEVHPRCGDLFLFITHDF